MKKIHQRILLLGIPLAAAALLSSCVVPVDPVDGRYASAGGSYGVYTTLPTTFVGTAYYYDGRYYSGGNYQTGRYHYAGRPYTSRYYYNGRYIYGGKFQQYNDSPRRSGNYDSSRRTASYDSDQRPVNRNSYSRRTHRR